MTDKQRQAFDQWALREGYPVEREPFSPGTYRDPRTHAAYCAWTAARKLALEEAAQIALRLCDHRPPEAVAAAIRQQQEEGNG